MSARPLLRRELLLFRRDARMYLSMIVLFPAFVVYLGARTLTMAPSPPLTPDNVVVAAGGGVAATLRSAGFEVVRAATDRELPGSVDVAVSEEDSPRAPTVRFDGSRNRSRVAAALVVQHLLLARFAGGSPAGVPADGTQLPRLVDIGEHRAKVVAGGTVLAALMIFLLVQAASITALRLARDREEGQVAEQLLLGAPAGSIAGAKLVTGSTIALGRLVTVVVVATALARDGSDLAAFLESATFRWQLLASLGVAVLAGGIGVAAGALARSAQRATMFVSAASLAAAAATALVFAEDAPPWVATIPGAGLGALLTEPSAAPGWATASLLSSALLGVGLTRLAARRLPTERSVLADTFANQRDR